MKCTRERTSQRTRTPAVLLLRYSSEHIDLSLLRFPALLFNSRTFCTLAIPVTRICRHITTLVQVYFDCLVNRREYKFSLIDDLDPIIHHFWSFSAIE